MSAIGNIARRLGFAQEQQTIEPTEAGIRQWMTERLARQLSIPVTQVDSSTRFDEYGLDSRVAVQVSGELEKIVERRLSPALLFEHPSIDEVAKTLAKQLATSPA